ncbi:uncharacterized protein [Montipora capricornis]|uniref:uncharacterized protein n=1 Tax=Montipora capricornis TaxID=246305 RepID=UPI0035F1D9D3
MRNQMAGNNLSWKQNAIDQTVENLSVGKSTAESRFPTNHSATNAMAGKLPLTNSVTSSQKTGNILMGNGQISSELSINPKAQRNRVEQNWPVVTGSQAGSSQVRGNLASAQSASSLIPPSPSNPGRDQGSMYRQPTSYDRKSSIYAQSSPSYGQPAKFNYSAENVKKSDIFTPYQNRPWYQYYPQMGNTPSFQPQHTGYPDFAHPKLDYVHDKVPLRRKFKQHKASKKSRIKSSTAALSKSNTIEIKLPDKHSTVNIAPTSKSLSVDDTAAEELASVSGSGFEFTGGLQDTADDPDDSDDLDESGSGDDNGYLNPGLLGGASDIAFMLADAKKRPPVFPAPGLPMNLTRQQAIDIYKSAMYFAGLMGSGELTNDIKFL